MERFILIILALSVVFSVSVQAKSYQNNDPIACLDESFTCPAGQYPFFDQQGCGCYKPTPCAERSDNFLSSTAVADSVTAFSIDPVKSKESDRYISRDTELCQQLRFACTTGFYPFFDLHGCGCASVNRHVASQCQPPSAFNLYATLTAKPDYLSTNTTACQQVRFRCQAPHRYPFFDQVGCGCRTQVCADTAQYFISREAAQCQQIRFTCRQDFTAFFSELGCGCVPVANAAEWEQSALSLSPLISQP